MNNKWPSHFQTSKPKYYIIVHGLTMMASTACLASFSDTICSDSPGTWLLWKLSQIIFLWKIIGNFQSLTGGACGETASLPFPATLSTSFPLSSASSLSATQSSLSLLPSSSSLSRPEKYKREDLRSSWRFWVVPFCFIYDANKTTYTWTMPYTYMSDRGKE